MDVTSQTLLGRARGGAADAWVALDRLYRPFIGRWFRRQGFGDSDADDLTQEVLAVLVRELPRFEHTGRGGAFRTWLRGMCLNRARDHRRRMRLRGAPEGGTSFQQELGDVADAHADDWDREHDAFVLRRLMDELAGEFEPASLAAFRRVTLDGASGQTVAAELGLTVAAVYAAKSRILKRLRELAAGLVDDGVLA